MADGIGMNWVDGVLAAMLLAIATIDFRTFRIPDWLSLPLITGGLVRAVDAGPLPWTAYWLGAAVGYTSLATFGAVYFRLRGREGLGLGDAKLFAAAGAWLGWQALPVVLASASLAGMLFALFTSRTRSGQQLAFGPWLSVAIWLQWLYLR